MKFFQKSPRKKLVLGEPVFAWEALDYYPYQRGVWWYICFCTVFFGSATWAVLTDPAWGWLTAFVFLVAMAVYFWKQSTLGRTHHIEVFENVIRIDTECLPLDQLAGYWFVFDETVAVLNLEFKQKKTQKISLQMGENPPAWFRDKFSLTTLSELKDRQEPLLDLWIRVLKL